MLGIQNLDSSGQANLGAGQMRLKTIKGNAPFRVSAITGTLDAPMTVRFPRDEGVLRLGVSFQGSAQVLKDSTQPYIVTSSTTSLCVENRDYYATFGRGAHKWLLITIPESDITALTAPLKDLGIASQPAHTIYFGASRPLLNASLSSLESAVTEDGLDGRALLTTIYGQMTQFAIERGFQQEVVLADIPPTATGSLLSLLEQVKEDPSRPWSLKDAANEAAYSAFHLSRIFRTFATYGFPEYVDRCRTEMAVKLLQESDLSVDQISNECRYGSTQALRNSCREYLGLLPSELRPNQGDS